MIKLQKIFFFCIAKSSWIIIIFKQPLLPITYTIYTHTSYIISFLQCSLVTLMFYIVYKYFYFKQTFQLASWPTQVSYQLLHAWLLSTSGRSKGRENLQLSFYTYSFKNVVVYFCDKFYLYICLKLEGFLSANNIWKIYFADIFRKF